MSGMQDAEVKITDPERMLAVYPHPNIPTSASLRTADVSARSSLLRDILRGGTSATQ